jgi:hypothetical protein
VKKVEEGIRPYADEILKCLSALWETSKDKKMVLAGIAKILGNLVRNNPLIFPLQSLEQELSLPSSSFLPY